MDLEKEYVRAENMKYLKFVVGFLGIVILGLFAVLFFINPQPRENLCTQDLKKFDEYIQDNKLSINNPDSLCFGINMSLDLKNLEPRYAVARFIGLSLDYKYTLQLEGETEQTTMNIPLTDQEAASLIVDGYYKIDVNNFCRQTLAMLDSRSPSPILETFTKPEEIICN